ncbi:unnamed protein product [Dovyalis caffra]|uniref:Uncharacterized protein n=1 Tax=Dovyalis caffra TaxID=77055 RepID=A0AAV1QXW8_9ROSI|nr:unnamed protein product [Dovyalis caffra]
MELETWSDKRDFFSMGVLEDPCGIKMDAKAKDYPSVDDIRKFKLRKLKKE